MDNFDKILLRDIADEVWEVAKNLKDYEVARKLKLLASEIHYLASEEKKDDLALPDRR